MNTKRFRIEDFHEAVVTRPLNFKIDHALAKELKLFDITTDRKQNNIYYFDTKEMHDQLYAVSDNNAIITAFSKADHVLWIYKISNNQIITVYGD